MSDDLISTIASVECRSEGRGEEIPLAIAIANVRYQIVSILDRAVMTSVEAGDPIRHRLWVALDDGRRCELTRIEPDGQWRVKMERSSGTDADSG